jgi:hypothetical protein
MKKTTYINESGLVRCGMCSVKAGESAYLPRSAFSEGMVDAAESYNSSTKGGVVACLKCNKDRKEKEFKTKVERCQIADKNAAQKDETDGLYRQFVFPKQQQKRVTR